MTVTAHELSSKFIALYAVNLETSFLIDTGSSYSIVSDGAFSNLQQDSTTFSWVNAEHKLKCKGKTYLVLQLENGFVIADYFYVIKDVYINILGLETMSKHHLGIDVASRSVVFPEGSAAQSPEDTPLYHINSGETDVISSHQTHAEPEIELKFIPPQIGVFETFFQNFPEISQEDRDAFVAEVTLPPEYFIEQCAHLDDDVKKLLLNHKSIMDPNMTLRHGIRGAEMPMVLKKDAKFTFQKPRNVPMPLRREYNKIVMRLSYFTIVDISIDALATITVHVVAGGENRRTRVVYDARPINDLAEAYPWPMPRPCELLQSIQGSQCLSLVDLRNAYLQVKVCKLATRVQNWDCTHTGARYCLTRMAPGYHSAGSWFMAFIKQILPEPYFKCYVDDILVCARNRKEMLERLGILFERLEENRVMISVSKSKFMVNKLVFLGSTITCDFVQPLISRVEAIQKIEKPRTVKEMMAYLGTLNYVRRHVRGVAKATQKLYSVVDCKKKSKRLQWDDDLVQAFESSKKILEEAVNLFHFDPEKETRLYCDSSDNHFGAFLCQVHEENGTEELKPLGFFSKGIPPAAKHKPIWWKELNAISLAMQSLWQYIAFSPIKVYTDNKIVYGWLTSGKELDLNPATYRTVTRILGFSPEVRLITSTENAVADMMSRNRCFSPEELKETGRSGVPEDTAVLKSASKHESIHGNDGEVSQPSILILRSTNPLYAELAADQATDTELQDLLKNPQKTNLNLVGKPIEHSDKLLYGHLGPDSEIFKPFITLPLREPFVNQIHSAGHVGSLKTAALVKSLVTFPNIDKTVKEIVKRCLQCQQAKIFKHHVSALTKYRAPTGLFDCWHIDHAFLPPCRGYTSVLICVCRHSRYVVVLPTKTVTAEEVVFNLAHYLFSIYGIPKVIISDNHQSYHSKLLKTFFDQTGVIHRFISPYMSQSNSLVERAIRYLKGCLRSVAGETQDWLSILPTIKLIINNCVNSTYPISANQAAFGRQLTLPGVVTDELQEQPEYSAAQAKEFMVAKNAVGAMPMREHPAGRKTQELDFANSSHVLLRKGKNVSNSIRTMRYEGPFRLLQLTKKNAIIERRGKRYKCSIDRLKPFYHQTLPAAKFIKRVYDLTPLTTVEEETLNLSSSDSDDDLIPLKHTLNENLPTWKPNDTLQSKADPRVDLEDSSSDEEIAVLQRRSHRSRRSPERLQVGM